LENKEVDMGHLHIHPTGTYSREMASLLRSPDKLLVWQSTSLTPNSNIVLTKNETPRNL